MNLIYVYSNIKKPFINCKFYVKVLFCIINSDGIKKQFFIKGNNRDGRKNIRSAIIM